MPLNIDWQQILLHLLNFCILAGGLYFLLYKPVRDFMEKRKSYYSDMEAEAKEALRQAQQQKQEADQARLALKDTLQKEREQAMASAEAESRRQLDQAARQADEILDAARKTALRRQEQAMKDSDRAIRELAITAAEKLALQEDPYDAFLKAQGRNGHDA